MVISPKKAAELSELHREDKKLDEEVEVFWENLGSFRKGGVDTMRS